jgi:RNA polymerase sigma factor (sigma-70 family)
MVARKVKRRRKPLTAEQQDLAARYVPLAHSLSASYRRAWPNEWNEFESASMMALTEAAETYDPSRGVPFATFARFRITGALRDVHRRLSHPLTLPRGSAVCTCGDMKIAATSGRVLMQAARQPDHAYVSADAFEQRMRNLPPRHAEVCRCLHVDGLNQAEIAQRMNLSQTRISTIRREAYAMLAGTFRRESTGE